MIMEWSVVTGFSVGLQFLETVEDQSAFLLQLGIIEIMFVSTQE